MEIQGDEIKKLPENRLPIIPTTEPSVKDQVIETESGSIIIPWHLSGAPDTEIV